MGAAALQHEVRNDAVEVEAVVVALAHELREIGHRVRGVAMVEGQEDVTGAGFHADLHDPTTRRGHLRLRAVRTVVEMRRPFRTIMGDLLDLNLDMIDGSTTTLRDVADGGRLLVVNVASACGLTRQYADLQRLHAKHDDLTVIGFPCNQFGAQEPGTHEEICAFTEERYGVTFPLTAKVDVNGANRHPIYAALCQETDDEGHTGDVRWNFENSSSAPMGTWHASSLQHPRTTCFEGSFLSVRVAWLSFGHEQEHDHRRHEGNDRRCAGGRGHANDKGLLGGFKQAAPAGWP